MNIDLTGKTALVCGSSRGIGRAVATELAELGARVILCARDGSTLRLIRDLLSPGAGQVHDYIAVDFSDPNAVRKEVNEFLSQGETVHILVNNTGGPPPGSAYDAKTKDFLDAFSMHLVCNQILVKAVVPGMKSEGYGRIVNIISTSVKEPIPGLGVSNSIRGAVASWAKTLSVELGPFGITVNNVLPGYTNTDRLSSLIERKASDSGKSIGQVEEEMKNRIPLHRFADPSETAAAVGFLVSPSGGYITGVNLPVDGGRLGCL